MNRLGKPSTSERLLESPETATSTGEART